MRETLRAISPRLAMRMFVNVLCFGLGVGESVDE